MQRWACGTVTVPLHSLQAARLLSGVTFDANSADVEDVLSRNLVCLSSRNSSHQCYFCFSLRWQAVWLHCGERRLCSSVRSPAWTPPAIRHAQITFTVQVKEGQRQDADPSRLLTTRREGLHL